MKTLIVASAAAMTVAAALGAARAQVAYDDSALNGCYSRLSTSVDTGTAIQSENAVGTTCFDGKGHIVQSTTAPHLSGGIINRDGSVSRHDAFTGTYKVTNSPGDGMGILDGPCARHAFSLRHVKDGLAGGFSYILLERKKGCKDNGPMVEGGTAEYQGPLK